MGDPLDDESHRPPTWEKFQELIHSWLVARFGINRPLDKDIWLFCIGTAMELERLAAGVLWVDDGRKEAFYEYPNRTLGRAHDEITKRGLLDDTTRATVKAVADLRNSVAHRHAIFVTAPSPVGGHLTGEYKGFHVFMYREALDELMRDFDAAAKAMYLWMAAKAPDLAEEAKRTGAHPTPP